MLEQTAGASNRSVYDVANEWVAALEARENPSDPRFARAGGSSRQPLAARRSAIARHHDRHDAGARPGRAGPPLSRDGSGPGLRHTPHHRHAERGRPSHRTCAHMRRWHEECAVRCANMPTRPAATCIWSSEDEAVALGAAVLAATACGAFPDLLSAAAAMVRPGATLRANSARRAFHDAKYRGLSRALRRLVPLPADDGERRALTRRTGERQSHVEPTSSGRTDRCSRVGNNEVLLVTNADLRESANVQCWPVQQAFETNCARCSRRHFGVARAARAPGEGRPRPRLHQQPARGQRPVRRHRPRRAGDRAADRLAVFAPPRRQPGAPSRADPAAREFRRHLARSGRHAVPGRHADQPWPALARACGRRISTTAFFHRGLRAWLETGRIEHDTSAICIPIARDHAVLAHAGRRDRPPRRRVRAAPQGDHRPVRHVLHGHDQRRVPAEGAVRHRHAARSHCRSPRCWWRWPSAATLREACLAWYEARGMTVHVRQRPRDRAGARAGAGAVRHADRAWAFRAALRTVRGRRAIPAGPGPLLRGVGFRRGCDRLGRAFPDPGRGQQHHSCRQADPVHQRGRHGQRHSADDAVAAAGVAWSAGGDDAARHPLGQRIQGALLLGSGDLRLRAVRAI